MKLFHIDAFTDKLFAGNPAAVFILNDDEKLSDNDMQNLALEMNLSESAFLKRENGQLNLRWFTPQAEVDLCGHATLATAHALWELGAAEDTIVFQTRSGSLSAYRSGGRIVIDLPAKSVQAVEPPGELMDALGVQPVYVGRSQFDFLVELDSVKTLKSMWPNMSKLERIPGRGIIVTARGETQGYDFVSRFFAPQVGVDEDPVTGSAHCVLAPYWAKKLEKTTLVACQASKRGGTLYIELKENRVLLGGNSTKFYSTELPIRFPTEL
ncbi:phenazine biosynthesis protein [Clostridia bacterium]|nr:phenazine biosynthesis protein [Clostridia bacterium]